MTVLSRMGLAAFKNTQCLVVPVRCVTQAGRQQATRQLFVGRNGLSNTFKGRQDLSKALLPKNKPSSNSIVPKRSYNSQAGPELTPAEKRKWMWLAASGATGVGIVCLSGLVQSSDGVGSFAPYVRSRLSSTYAYLAGGLGITAASAYYLNAAGFSRVLMTTNPWIVVGASAVATISTMMATRMIHQERVLMKHTAWTLFNVSVGASLAPIAMIGGPIVMKAAAITGCIIGSISLVAASAPSEQFLWMGGPLTLGLGVVVASGLGSMFFPASPILYNISLYGGLGLFGGFFLYDTGKVIHHAERNGQFDPINECMGLYLNTINIFTRIVTILMNNQRRRR